MLLYVIYLAAIIDVCAIAYCADATKPFKALFGVVVLVALAWFAGYPVVSFVADHWRDVLLGFGAYLLTGIPWAFFKWYRFALDARKDLRKWLEHSPVPERRRGFVYGRTGRWTALDEVHPSDVPEGSEIVLEPDAEYASSLRRYAERVPHPVRFDVRAVKFDLPASDHKERITTWMAFWPFSALGTLLDDLLFRVWEALYGFCSGLFQRVSDAVFADVGAKK